MIYDTPELPEGGGMIYDTPELPELGDTVTITGKVTHVRGEPFPLEMQSLRLQLSDGQGIETSVINVRAASKALSGPPLTKALSGPPKRKEEPK